MTDPRPPVLSTPWDYLRLDEADIGRDHRPARVIIPLPDGGEIEIRGTPDIETIAMAVSAVPELLTALIHQRDAIDRWTRTGRPVSPKEARILHARNRAALARACGRPAAPAPEGGR